MPGRVDHGRHKSDFAKHGQRRGYLQQSSSTEARRIGRRFRAICFGPITRRALDWTPLRLAGVRIQLDALFPEAYAYPALTAHSLNVCV